MDVTVITHSTVLAAAEGERVLIDPLFGIAGRMQGIVQPALPADDVTDVDAVLVTHGHPDHVDPGYFEKLGPETTVIVPEGMAWPEGMQPLTYAQPLPYWQTRTLGHFMVTCVPATHRGVACGFVLEADGRVLYVAGDTHWDDAMPTIGERWRIDLALLPARLRPDIPVMDAMEMARAVRALKPTRVIVYHTGYAQPTGAPARAADAYLAALHDEAPGVPVSAAEHGATVTL